MPPSVPSPGDGQGGRQRSCPAPTDDTFWGSVRSERGTHRGSWGAATGVLSLVPSYPAQVPLWPSQSQSHWQNGWRRRRRWAAAAQVGAKAVLHDPLHVSCMSLCLSPAPGGFPGSPKHDKLSQSWRVTLALPPFIFPGQLVVPKVEPIPEGDGEEPGTLGEPGGLEHSCSGECTHQHCWHVANPLASTAQPCPTHRAPATTDPLPGTLRLCGDGRSVPMAGGSAGTTILGVGCTGAPCLHHPGVCAPQRTGW